MTKTITPETFPPGARVLVTPNWRTEIIEWACAEWSPKGYVRIAYRHGTSRWISPQELVRFVIVDILEGSPNPYVPTT